MRRPAWVLAAGPGRVLIEAGLAVFLWTLLLTILFAAVPDPDRRWSALRWAPASVGLLVGIGSAVRLRRRSGRRWQEAKGAAAPFFGTAVGGVLAIALGSFVAARSGWVEHALPPLAILAPDLGGFAAVASVAAYALGRGLVLAWPGWDRRRRTRLLWALTHAQLVGSLSLTCTIAALLTMSAVFAIALQAWRETAGDTDSAADRAVTFVAAFSEQMVPATVFFVLASLVIGVVVVVPVALISVVVLPRTTRRLEELAAATASLRAGNLAARVPIAGEDEVARLQADFNAMATDLGRSLTELGAERDAVARLLADRRQLVAAVSHELRTPVATLRGYLDSALAHWNGAPPPTLRDDLATMAAETERLGRLIDDLFTLSRAEVDRLPITLRPTDVAALLRRAAGAAAPLAWQRGRVEVLAETPPDLPSALVDPDRLEQAVRNLLANAVRHTPPGGVVLLGATADGDALLVQVKDTGEGIAPEDLPHLWDRFYRAGTARERDRDGGGAGAGLGLALVKELTEAMGGTVGVESAPGVGSCFWLRVPIATADPARPDPPRTETPPRTV